MKAGEFGLISSILLSAIISRLEDGELGYGIIMFEA